MSASSAKAVVAAYAVLAAVVLVPAAVAGGGGSVSTATTSIAAGTSLTVTACVATDGDGGYLIIKGPDTFAQDFFFGPVTGCTDVIAATVGWAPGKYRIIGYEFTSKGTKGLGMLTVTVT
jgi:hypothetical protein